jgi:pantoate kinase
MAEVKVASMAMLGQTLFAVVHHSEAQAVAEKFRRYTENTMITPLGKRAATVL